MMTPAAHLQTWFGDALAGAAIADLRLDSRMVCANDVFFALSANEVINSHIEQALNNGAVAIVVDRSRAGVVSSTKNVFLLDDLPKKLGDIANNFYGSPSQACKVVGITGTNGKTTCSHWLAQTWQQLAGNAGIIGTLGCGLIADTERRETGLTTPDVLSNQRLLADMVKRNAQMVAMEVSSHALDQGRVDGVHFDTAIFTNLSRDHLDYHGDMQSYAAAKQKLFERASLQHAVINLDDDYGKKLTSLLRNSDTRVLSYALNDKTADLGVERCEVTGQGLDASIRTPWGRGALQSKYPGGYNLLNVLAVVATLCAHGMSLQTVLGVVAQLQAVPGRTQIVSKDSDDILVVVDYAHTPDALQKVLVALREQVKKQLWCVFGCGGNRDRGKRPQMAAVAAAASDVVVVTSDNPRDEVPANIIADIVPGFSGHRFKVIEDRAAAIAYSIGNASAGDVVLLAGKGHENYQEILGKRMPFSDIDQAHSALSARRGALAGGVA
ncbi:MAG TPA: UDP-N-acetylmuramoyl-L-alanyl-D-glutamate--2,6-diaminopimelate ligase [Pseudomonadales bacterium]|nr:UDP-N-acetylmuramoyl-L-alanyl-D-glutamate--2,6-diaminopimelate ligase [Pseudomonadales bacterium]